MPQMCGITGFLRIIFCYASNDLQHQHLPCLRGHAFCSIASLITPGHPMMEIYCILQKGSMYFLSNLSRWLVYVCNTTLSVSFVGLQNLENGCNLAIYISCTVYWPCWEFYAGHNKLVLISWMILVRSVHWKTPSWYIHLKCKFRFVGFFFAAFSALCPP